jgi:hypothetical protein
MSFRHPFHIDPTKSFYESCSHAIIKTSGHLTTLIIYYFAVEKALNAAFTCASLKLAPALISTLYLKDTD